MPDMMKAVIQLRSHHEGEEVVQDMLAEVFAKDSVLYVKYEELEAGPRGGSIRTTIKITPDVVKIIRHGEVESEQSYQLDTTLPGFYRSPYTTFNLSTYTHEMKMDIQGGIGHVSWSYDLYVYDDLSGVFTISLYIQEEPKL
ncbi:DUF1934 domain-containing protein [Paenibacillus sp. DS2015]|uniref:DUF1934 domain-containing protein n=1 Tax=Paenibacillus sp. DS2015 TaxID=3373917 RepID=UPI003D1EE7FC